MRGEKQSMALIVQTGMPSLLLTPEGVWVEWQGYVMVCWESQCG